MRLLRRVYRTLSAILFLPVLAAASTPVTIEALNANPSNTTSVLNLYCHNDDGQYFQSRIALIKSSDPNSDYAVSTGHGFTPTNGKSLTNCHVKSFGKSYQLSGIHIANAFVPGSATDWAIIKLPRIRDAGIVRYKLPNFSKPSQLAFQHQANLVTFPKARGLSHNSQTCLSLPAAYAGIKETNIMAHDCRVIAGQSGSPVAASHNGQDVLIGIHLGQSFILQSPVTRRPESFGYFRFFDQKMVQDIDLAVRNFKP